jgi:hypothetical protein
MPNETSDDPTAFAKAWHSSRQMSCRIIAISSGRLVCITVSSQLQDGVEVFQRFVPAQQKQQESIAPPAAVASHTLFFKSV